MKQIQSREQFARLIGETHRLWRMRMNERLRPLGLSQARWTTLRALSRGGDAMPQTELAARVGIEPPTLVGILDGLARSGFVERRASISDRRVKTIHLTPKAQRKLEQIEAVAQTLRAEVTQKISAGALNAAIGALDSVKNQLMEITAQEKAQTMTKASRRRRVSVEI